MKKRRFLCKFVMAMSNRKLFIIGNGFDLHHGLKTSYADFCRYVEENDKELYEFLGQYVCLKLDKDRPWRDFEQDLDTFDCDVFYDNYDNTDPSHENFQLSDMFGVVDELRDESETMIEKMQQALYDWLCEIDYADIKCELLPLDTNTQYLTFNYTSTLNRVYSIPDNNILPIHHSIAKHGSDLVFGHGTTIEDKPEFDEYDNSNYPSSAYREAECASKWLLVHFCKNTRAIILENREFFDSLHDVDEIIVLGHSLNDIDLPYFEHLNKIANKAKWIISYYDDSEPDKMRNALLRAGVESALSFEKIEKAIT